MFPTQRSVLSYFTNPDPTPSVLSAHSVPVFTSTTATAPAPAAAPHASYMDIFCDGACVGNGSARARAGFGLYVKLEGRHCTEVSEALDRSEIQTNQRAELRAFQRALEFAAEAESQYKIRIFTDSMYSINCITTWASTWSRNNWCKTGQKEEIQHRDIIESAYKLWLSVKHKTTVEHVRSHTGKSDWKSFGNKRADELATASIRSKY